MITPGTLSAKGWTAHRPGEMRIVIESFEYYFFFLGDDRCSIGVLEEGDDATPFFEGKISDQDTLQQILELTVLFTDVGGEAKNSFDMMQWLLEHGWEGDDHELVKGYEDDEAIYTCTKMGNYDYIITREYDDDPELMDYIYNGSILDEAQAEMIIKALEIP